MGKKRIWPGLKDICGRKIKTKKGRLMSKKLGKEMWEKFYYEDPLLMKAREVAKTGNEFVEYVCQNVKNTDEELFPQLPGAPPRIPRRKTRQRTKDLQMVDSPYFPIIDLDKLFAEHKGHLLTRKPYEYSESDDYDRPPKSGINYEGSLCILNPDIYNNILDDDDDGEEEEEEEEENIDAPSTSKVNGEKGHDKKSEHKKAHGITAQTKKARRTKTRWTKARRMKAQSKSVLAADVKSTLGKKAAVTHAPTPLRKKAAVTQAPTPLRKKAAVTHAPTPLRKKAAVTHAPTPLRKKAAVTQAPTPGGIHMKRQRCKPVPYWLSNAYARPPVVFDSKFSLLIRCRVCKEMNCVHTAMDSN